MTIFNFTVKRFFRSLLNLLLLFVLPLGILFLPKGEWLPIPLGFQYYGLLQLFIAAKLASNIIEDRTNGIMVRIGVAPITHFQYLWQNLLAFSLILTGLNVLFIMAGVLVHGEELISPLRLFIVYSFFSMIAIGFSLAWYSLFRSKEAAFLIISGVIILMAMLGGMMWPVQAMPAAFQRIAMLLPTYWFVEGILVSVRGGTVVNFVMILVIMFMYSLAFIILGSRRKIT